MIDDGKVRARVQFGATVDQYASSAVHAHGDSLRMLVECVCPQPDATVLDVACGAGHTALRFAPHVGRVIATDLTDAMVLKTAELAAERSLDHVYAAVADAESLPFANESIDVLTCRLAFHHLPHPARAIAEFGRVLKPHGVVALADNVTVSDTTAAEYYNTYERLRDPSHHQVYSLAQLHGMLADGGLRVEAARTLAKELEFEEWADRQRVTQADRETLQQMMRQIPAPLEPLFAPRWADGTMYFSLWEAVLLARRAEPPASSR